MERSLRVLAIYVPGISGLAMEPSLQFVLRTKVRGKMDFSNYLFLFSFFLFAVVMMRAEHRASTAVEPALPVASAGRRRPAPRVVQRHGLQSGTYGTCLQPVVRIHFL